MTGPRRKSSWKPEATDTSLPDSFGPQRGIVQGEENFGHLLLNDLHTVYAVFRGLSYVFCLPKLEETNDSGFGSVIKTSKT